MSNLVGAQAIADKLSRIAGQPVSRWQVYRLAKRRHTPIKRDSEGYMLQASSSDLRDWWANSRFAPIFAKQLASSRGARQPDALDVLRIFGVIGAGDLTDRSFLAAIDELDSPKAIRLLINSEGGAVAHGLAMYHALRSHKAKVEVEIVGVAASMASAIAMAGDKVCMAEDALFMLHDPWVAAAGNAEDLRSAADMLDKHGESLAAIYARKSGIDEARVKEMMSKDGGDGTWLNAKEALEAGFIDEILQPANAKLPELPAAALAKRICKGAHVMKWKNLVAALKAAIAALATAETDENAIIEQVAEATEIDVEDVNSLLEGKGDEPTVESLQAYAEVLDLDLDTLITAVGKDGLKLEAPTKKPASQAKPKRRKPIQTASAQNVDVAAAVRDALAEQAKVRSQISTLGERLGIPTEVSAKIATDCFDIESANARMIEYLSDPKNSPRLAAYNGHVTNVADERDKWIQGMANWLIIKSGNARMVEAHSKQSTGKIIRLDAGEFRGFRLLDIARDSLERNGINTRGMSPRDIAKRASQPRADSRGLGTTSDFPILLENVLHKMLMAAYETAPDQWRAIAAVGSVQDFRDHPRLKMGQLPRLSTLLESGEFKNFNVPDAEKETIKAGTFGNLVGLTRQAIINDDVDGFTRLVVMLGRAAARSIEIDTFALLASNSGLGPTMGDGSTLFHADHSNIAGSAGLTSVTTLEAARILMAQQKDPAGEDFLDIRPSVWVGPIGQGAAARTAVNAEFDFDAETSGNTGKFMKPNVVRDLVSTIVDTPRLSGNRWYLLADPAIAPVLEVVFLEGQEAPVIESEEGFGFDGVRWKIRHDYGVGATDFRGAVTNAGS